MHIFLSLSRFFIRLYALTAGGRIDRRLMKYLRYIVSLFDFRLVLLHLPKGQVSVRKPFDTCENLAIVMQGPLIDADDFTFETVRGYLKQFPDALIVVSTWSDQPDSAVQKLRALGVSVITTEKPSSSGPMNINFQLVSTRAGIQFALDRGVGYVIKTRTDCRFYASNIWGYLKGLWHLFPPGGETSMRGRLFTLDYATRMYVPYHIADIFMFGHVQDMLSYWQAPLSELEPLSRAECDTLGNIWKDQIPEVYLCRSFVKKHLSNERLDDVGAWWQFLAKYFVVIDRADIGFYWAKYAISNENFLEDELDARSFAVVSFRDWICFLASADAPRLPVTEDLKRCAVNEYVNCVD